MIIHSGKELLSLLRIVLVENCVGGKGQEVEELRKPWSPYRPAMMERGGYGQFFVHIEAENSLCLV